MRSGIARTGFFQQFRRHADGDGLRMFPKPRLTDGAINKTNTLCRMAQRRQP
jgi:hypothetical protein